MAAAKRCTVAQIALAWLLAQGEDIVPIPGTKRRRYLEENCRAIDIKLTRDELDALTTAFAPGATAGGRYPEKQLKGLGI
jgi:aryl-alcohol dehydrogenase-like predicted oxidoreductase